jgi:hypothetical protein
MALIVEQHVVADMYPIAVDQAVSAGMIVELSAGLVIPATTGSVRAIGIAGDSNATTEGQTTAYSAEVVIGSQDADTARTRWTSNRVSDMYNETLGSGKMTVYNGGGKFWISDDLFDTPGAVTSGDPLAVSTNTAGEWDEASSTAVNDFIAIAVGNGEQYPSGVPGTDTADGSIAIGTPTANDLWIPVVLRI